MADLIVLKEELLRYEAGEVAHIENVLRGEHKDRINVLRGEHKDRIHRRLRSTEDTLATEVETENSSHRDLESTERYELQTETATTIAQDTQVSAGVTESTRVPDGYVAKEAWAVAEAAMLNGEEADLRLFIGRKRASWPHTALDDENAELPISLIGVRVAAYVVHVEILCKRRRERFQTWQLETFAALMTGYREKQALYAEARAVVQIRSETFSGMSSSARKREIERTELKKHSLSLLTGQHFDLFDAMRRDVGPNGYPQMKLVEAQAEGDYIQFFEQAFEWSQMSYVFYPYFWGRKDWIVAARV